MGLRRECVRPENSTSLVEGQIDSGSPDARAELRLCVDSSHRVVAVSDLMHRLTGLCCGDVLSADPTRFLDPDEGRTLVRAYRTATRTAGAVEFVTVRLVDDGEFRRSIELRLEHRCGAGGDGGIVITGVDVTNDSARRVVDRLRSRLLELLPTVVTVVDDVGTLVYCSPRSIEVLGYHPREVVGRSIADSGLIQLAPADIEAIRRSAETDGHWVGDAELRRKDGSTIPVQLVLERIDDDEIGFHGSVGISFDVSERRELEASLEFQASHDALTGLYNRQRFVALLEGVLEDAKALGRRLAVFFIDIDDFKSVNDRVGHEGGDELLAAVAASLESALVDGCVAARFGGDEFVCFSTGPQDITEATRLAQRLLDAVGQPIRSGSETVVVSASVGIALSDDDTLAEELLRRSDVAMYDAKDNGKSRIEIFDDDVGRRKRRHREMADELDRAIDRGELVVHYQPEMTLSDGRIAGFEALIRWEHPIHGSMPPGEFITVAEASGLIHRIGHMVVDQACSALRRWIDLGLADGLMVAVNVSPRQLLDHRFPEVVAELVSKWGVPAEQVCIEVTETALVDDDPAMRALRRLDETGVLIAIDDFGTGYSSLGRLTRYPLDFLKIDRTFVMALGVDHTSETIVEMVVELAHSLGLQAIAEGIETPAHLRFLAHVGCDIGQGFLWNTAVPLDEATTMLAASESVDPLWSQFATDLRA